MKENLKAMLFYRARKFFVKHPETDFSRYFYITGDQEMDRAIFDAVKAETPEMRMKHLRGELFKSGGALPVIPDTAFKAEAEEEREAPREYGRKIIKGNLPAARFPPARIQTRPRRVINTPEHQAQFERFLLNSETEKTTPIAEPSAKVIPVLVSVPVPELITQTKEDPMTRTYIPVAERSEKKEKEKPKSALEITLEKLKAIQDKGEELPSLSEYKKDHDKKIQHHTFYGARNKLLKGGNKISKASAAGRGKPAQVFQPASAGMNGHARAHVEIIYTSDESPDPVVMTEVEKVIRKVLSSFANYAGMEVSENDLQIRNFTNSGWEIRRIVK